jgi:cation diffusion facilitator family transporter
MEYVTGFIVDMLIMLVGFELLKSSFEKILNPVPTAVGDITLILLAVAIFVKLWLYFFYMKIAKRVSSATVKASALDSLTDCIATALVLVSAVIARIWNIYIDGWAGILVAAFILYSGFKAAKETIDLLLGSPPDPEFIESIYEFVKPYPHIVGIHDVMVHDYGPGRQIVSFHAEVPADSDINIAHEEVDQLETDLHAKFGCIVTVHLDPLVVNDPILNELKSLSLACAKEIDERFTIHDFRMTKGETQINLIFDLVMPADYPQPSAQVSKQLAEKIKEKDCRCNCVIRAEHPFV